MSRQTTIDRLVAFAFIVVIAVTGPKFGLGADCNGDVDFEDIDGFVQARINKETCEVACPPCRWLNADIHRG